VEPDPLAGRVARFHELEGNDALLVDTAIPRFARTIWSIIGRNVGEDRDERPPIPAEGFHLAVIKAPPGNGTALHDHTTAEVFMALTGRWLVLYGPDGGRELELGPWDVCSVPAGVWRGFRNLSGEDACLLAVIEGDDAGRITWAPGVEEEAARHGRMRDAEGYLTS